MSFKSIWIQNEKVEKNLLLLCWLAKKNQGSKFIILTTLCLALIILNIKTVIKL